jgi:hypothetical protein
MGRAQRNPSACRRGRGLNGYLDREAIRHLNVGGDRVAVAPGIQSVRVDIHPRRKGLKLQHHVIRTMHIRHILPALVPEAHRNAQGDDIIGYGDIRDSLRLTPIIGQNAARLLLKNRCIDYLPRSELRPSAIGLESVYRYCVTQRDSVGRLVYKTIFQTNRRSLRQAGPVNCLEQLVGRPVTFLPSELRGIPARKS